MRSDSNRSVKKHGFFSGGALSGAALVLVGCMAPIDAETPLETGGAENVGEVEAALTTFEVGPGKAYSTLQAVAPLLKAGDVVRVSGGATYAGGVRFSAQGSASNKIRIVGVRVNGARPVLSGGANSVEFAGNHYIFEGFDVTGGTSRCVYHHADDITVRDTVIHDCPSHGVLGADSDSGSLTLEYSEVYRCGSGDTRHQIYMATDESAYPGAVFRMQHSYVHDGNGGNNVKSRAQRNEIYYNWIEGAYYHEVELIGPDGQDEDLAREDSEVVGNVLYQTYPTRSHYAIRIGGDGTGQTFGRYRFLNNTVVLADATTSAVFRVFDGIESVEMSNNALYRQGGGAVTVLTDGDASWVHGRVIAGSNNWVTSGSSGIPSTWTNTRQAASPGFVNVAGRDLTLASTSPLRDAGTTSPPAPSGYPFPSPTPAATYEAPKHAAPGLDAAVRRANSGAPDIGAFEYGNGSTPPATAVTLVPVADAFVRAGSYASVNYGSATSLNVKTDPNASYLRDAYLRFDLASVSSVTSAKLRVYGALDKTGSVGATAYPVTGAWAEASLTFANAPGYVTTNALGTLAFSSTGMSWHEVDVTTYAKSERAAGRTALSFALHGGKGNGARIDLNSREASSGRPELVVTP